MRNRQRAGRHRGCGHGRGLPKPPCRKPPRHARSVSAGRGGPPPPGNAQVARADETPLAAAGPRAMARSEAAAPAPRPTLVFKTVDYVDTGRHRHRVDHRHRRPGRDDLGLLRQRASRRGARRSRRLWRVVVEKKLGIGQHNFRAEQAGAATGALARTPWSRSSGVEPKPEPPKAQPAATGPSDGRYSREEGKPGDLHHPPGRHVVGHRQALSRQRLALHLDLPG